MKILKIINLGEGKLDYKGLDINRFIPGSQLYAEDYSVFYVYTAEENIPDHPDVQIVSQEEYDEFKQYLLNLPKPKSDLEVMQEELNEVKANLQIAKNTIDFLLGV
jgi:hypothetical protein